jgi:hypothetical protein
VASKSTAGWKCPNCGRNFARPQQAHSCQVVPLSAHLKKASPEIQAIYQAVVAHLRTCGPLDVVPTKTGINLLSCTSLGGIQLQKTKARISFVLTRQVSDRRIQRVLQISPRSFVHYVELTTVSDLDRDIQTWLQEAHHVGMLAGKRV